MDIYISPRITGLGKYLVATDNNRYFSSGVVPKEEWVLGEPGNKSIDELAKVSGRDLRNLPSEKYVRAVRSVSSLENVPWKMILPAEAYKLYIQKLIDDARQTLGTGSINYYENIFKCSRSYLDSLEPIRVDQLKLSRYLMTEDSDSQRSALLSFKTDDVTGMIEPPRYHQFSTKTGRMTIKSGPKVLTLRKDLRDIFRTRYDRGRILQVDFSALEARLALAVVGKTAPKDIYTTLGREIFSGSLTRDDMKIITISTIFGAGWKSIMERLECDKLTAKGIRREIRKFFEIEKISSGLIEEMSEEGIIRNFYGRVLNEDSDTENILYQNYIQSTSVDVTCLGFTSFLEKIKRSGCHVSPLFSIHDALFLDVHEDSEKKLEEIILEGETIKPFSLKFYMKSKEILD